MSTLQHTSGPWEADHCTERRQKDDPGYFQIDASGPVRKSLAPNLPYTVADTMNRHYTISPEEDAANARLIAAAPEMFEALIYLSSAAEVYQQSHTSCGDNPCEFCRGMSYAESAIRKAKEGR